MLAEFEALLESLEAVPPRGVLFVFRRAVSFVPGGLGGAEATATADRLPAAAARIARAQRLADRLDELPAPTVALLAGPTRGGWLEVALTCDARLAADGAEVTLGFPEISLGVLPTLGATWAVPRLGGLRHGLDWLLSGRRLAPRQALRGGWVDEVVPPETLARAGEARLESLALLAPGMGGGRATFRAPRRGASLERWLAPWMLRAATRRVRARTGDLYPAPLALLEAVAAGVRGGRGAAMRVEAERSAALANSAVARNLARLDGAAHEAARSAPRSGPGPGPGPGLRHERVAVGVLGAGFMGSGIAEAAARRGCRVRLFDRRPEALGQALAVLAAAGRSAARRREASPAAATATLEPRGFQLCDVVIEAIVEELEAKRELLSRIEPQLRESALLASNTSTIPIAALARGLRYPNRVVGLHFFSPVRRMRLVEVVRGPATAEPFVARAVEFVRSLGKLPIVVRDGPGFYTTRILSPYLAQAVLLVAEGQSIARVDRVARRLGFPVGPLELLDEVGIDIAARAAQTVAAAFPERMPPGVEFRRLLEQGRLGRKVGQGFYDYKRRRKRPDPRVEDLLALDDRPAPVTTDEEIGERLVLALVCEALRCRDEGVIASALDGDLAAVLGIGFPPHWGGPFRYAESRGPADLAAALDRLADRHGAAYRLGRLD